MSKANSGLFSGTKGSTNSSSGGGDFVDFPKKINKGAQGKHIVGHSNYQPGKSIFEGTIQYAQKLINKFSGTGETINSNKERVNFKKTIGKYVDPTTGKSYSTTNGIIHYSKKKGTHIVPSHP